VLVRLQLKRAKAVGGGHGKKGQWHLGQRLPRIYSNGRAFRTLQNV
jgi:hypothetical protein